MKFEEKMNSNKNKKKKKKNAKKNKKEKLSFISKEKEMFHTLFLTSMIPGSTQRSSTDSTARENLHGTGSGTSSETLSLFGTSVRMSASSSLFGGHFLSDHFQIHANGTKIIGTTMALGQTGTDGDSAFSWRTIDESSYQLTRNFCIQHLTRDTLGNNRHNRRRSIQLLVWEDDSE
jgi:hypothetical protein